jgi:hypothetical protein
MAAPTPTARGTPSGIRLRDGFSTKVTFATDSTIELWEVEVTPPGLDGGDPIDTTTMFNTSKRTMGHRQLRTLTEFEFQAAYDPACYDALDALINVDTTVTVTFPDGGTLAFFGFLQKVEFESIKEGEMPKLTATVVPTNTDSSGAEQNFVGNWVSGT